jgi:hypothetical protein
MGSDAIPPCACAGGQITWESRATGRLALVDPAEGSSAGEAMGRGAWARWKLGRCEARGE